MSVRACACACVCVGLSQFTGFCAKLARKRRAKPPQPVPPQGPHASGLKRSILEKLDALLEHGDDAQLARIEQ